MEQLRMRREGRKILPTYSHLRHFAITWGYRTGAESQFSLRVGHSDLQGRGFDFPGTIFQKGHTLRATTSEQLHLKAAPLSSQV
jgi:hypothetical protein